MSTQTIAVAMSGGVDSSTVAAMLRAEGHNVVGLTMQLWNQRRLAGHEGMPEQVQGRCCSIDHVYDARRVAEDLGIPYYVVNHEERFENDVVRHLFFHRLLFFGEQEFVERAVDGGKLPQFFVADHVDAVHVRGQRFQAA